jgi:hypothetical protein
MYTITLGSMVGATHMPTCWPSKALPFKTETQRSDRPFGWIRLPPPEGSWNTVPTGMSEKLPVAEGWEELLVDEGVEEVEEGAAEETLPGWTMLKTREGSGSAATLAMGERSGEGNGDQMACSTSWTMTQTRRTRR